MKKLISFITVFAILFSLFGTYSATAQEQEILTLLYDDRYTFDGYEVISVESTNITSYKAGYEIDENQRVVFENNVPLDLTTKEFDLLMLFVKNKGTAFLREQILTKVWDQNFYGSDRVVDDTLRRLRKKMPKINIQTIYGFGYRLG